MLWPNMINRTQPQFSDQVRELQTLDGLRKLDQLDLEAFASMEEREGRPRIHHALMLIKQEIVKPFDDASTFEKSFEPMSCPERERQIRL